MVDTSGKRTATYTYGPYGEPRTNSGTQQPFRYTSAYLGPTGLYKMGARYYDPDLGRFTQPDPSGQESNPYLYAAADPVNSSDPTGNLSFPDVSGALDWASLTEKITSGDAKGAGPGRFVDTDEVASGVCLPQRRGDGRCRAPV
ncbi:RHS repeat-associated core domain-containing protein [Streptomyces eurythermus]